MSRAAYTVGFLVLTVFGFHGVFSAPDAANLATGMVHAANGLLVVIAGCLCLQGAVE